MEAGIVSGILGGVGKDLVALGIMRKVDAFNMWFEKVSRTDVSEEARTWDMQLQ